MPSAEHLLGMGACPAGNFYTAEHAGDFFDALCRRQWFDRGSRGLPVGYFRHPQVIAGLARYLGQVRHAQNLAGIGKFTKAGADDFSHAAADTGVYFVKNEGGYRGFLHGYDLQREADSRQFAARGDFGHRSCNLARVDRNSEFDAIAAGRPNPVASRCIDLHFEATAGHAQFLHMAPW